MAFFTMLFWMIWIGSSLFIIGPNESNIGAIIRSKPFNLVCIFFRQSLKSHGIQKVIFLHSGNTKSGRQMKAKHFLNQQYFVFIFWLNFNLHRKLSHFLCCLSNRNCFTEWVRKKGDRIKKCSGHSIQMIAEYAGLY